MNSTKILVLHALFNLVVLVVEQQGERKKRPITHTHQIAAPLLYCANWPNKINDCNASPLLGFLTQNNVSFEKSFRCAFD